MSQQKKRHHPPNKAATPSSTISTSSSTCLDDTAVAGVGGGDREVQSGGWRWSKTRQVAFWVKNSIRDVVTPDLSCVYEQKHPTKKSITPSRSNTTTTESSLLKTYNVNLFSENTTLASLTATTPTPDDTTTSDKQHQKHKIEEEEESYLFPPCQNIDQAMASLHTLQDYGQNADDKIDNAENITDYGDNRLWNLDYRKMPCFQNYYSFNFPVDSSYVDGGNGELLHDWLLDGDLQQQQNSHNTTSKPPIQQGQHQPYCQQHQHRQGNPQSSQLHPESSSAQSNSRRKEFGDEDLDLALASMELELSLSSESDDIDNVNMMENTDDAFLTSSALPNINNSSTVDVHNENEMRMKSGIHHKNGESSPDDNDCNGEDECHGEEEGENDIPKNLVMTTCLTPDNTRLRFPNPWEPALPIPLSPSLTVNDDKMPCSSVSTSRQRRRQRSSAVPECLPLADVFSIEGRFTRRLQLLEEEEEEVEEEEEQENKHCIIEEGDMDSNPVVSEIQNQLVENRAKHIDDGNCDDVHDKDMNGWGEKDDLLPPLYYTQDYDPLFDILCSIPWDDDDTGNANSCSCDNSDSDNGSITRIDAYLSQTLSELDEASQRVHQKLVREILRKEDEINAGMKRIQDVDFDVSGAIVSSRQANVYLQRARGREAHFRSTYSDGKRDGTAIGRNRDGLGIGRGGMGVGILGGNYIVKLADHREKLRELESILASCQEILEMDQRVDAFTRRDADLESYYCRADEFQELVEMCAGWIMQLNKATEKNIGVGEMAEDHIPLEQLSCFDELRKRVWRAMATLTRYLDSSVIYFIAKVCDDSWDDNYYLEYNTLVGAHYMLYHGQHVSGMNGYDEMEKTTPISDTQIDNSAKIFSKTITKALCFEVDRCLARALLDPTEINVIKRSSKGDVRDKTEQSSSSSSSSSDFDSNLLEIRMKIADIQANDDDAASLRALTHNLMVIRFQFEDRNSLLPWVYHKLCVLLANVLHTHYLLTRWSGCSLDNNYDDLSETLVNDKLNYRNFDSEQKNTEAGGEKGNQSVSSNRKQQFSTHPSRLQKIDVSDAQRHFSAMPLPVTTNDDAEQVSENFLEQQHRINSTYAGRKPTSCNLKRCWQRQDDDRDREISNEILKSKLKLWKHCERVITHFLETSTSFLSSRKMTKHVSTGIPSSYTTMLQIEHLYDILHLSNQMITLAREFVGPEICKSEGIVQLYDINGDQNNGLDVSMSCSDSNRSSYTMKEILCVILRGKLRKIHIESMNEIGNMLANESWQLMSYPFSNGTLEGTPTRISETTTTTTSREQVQQFIESMLEDSSSLIESNDEEIPNFSKLRTWHNRFYSSHQRKGCVSEKAFLPTFLTKGNPFLINNDYDSTYDNPAKEETRNVDNHYTNLQNNLYDKIASWINTNEMELTILTKSSTQIVRWTSRLFQLLEKFPIIREDITNVVCNIYDLYYLTVFRLCVGSERQERIVLGLDSRSSIYDLSVPSRPLQQEQQQQQQQNQQQQKQQQQQEEHPQQRSVSSTTHINAPFGRRYSNNSCENLSSSTHNGLQRYVLSDSQSSYTSTIQNSATAITVTNHHNLQCIEADIYSPLRSENELVEHVKIFIQRGQNSLSDIVDLNKIEGWSPNTRPCANTSGSSTCTSTSSAIVSGKEIIDEALVLEKRIVASFSCMLISCVFDTALHRLKINQGRHSFQYLLNGVIYQQQMQCSLPRLSATTTTDDIALCTYLDTSLVEYWMQMQDASSHMHLLCMRMCTMRAIKGGYIVRRIISIGSGWTAETLNEACNEYVDILSERCTLLWGHMSTRSTFLDQECILRQAWDSIIESSFVSMLEGFSRVSCSTEGRALMSIDLATFCASVNGTVIQTRLESHFGCVGKLPPSSAPLRGMQYVDLYVKVFYFPEDDIMKWIIEHRHLYHLSHLLALVSFSSTNPQSQVLLREQVKKL